MRSTMMTVPFTTAAILRQGERAHPTADVRTLQPDGSVGTRRCACGINSDEQVATLMWNNQEHDLKFQIAGLNTGHDEVVLSGDPSRDRDFTSSTSAKASGRWAADLLERR